MIRGGAIATYARAGGRPPEDDERLEIHADGTWELWRTMGGPRVGAFSGRLSSARRRRLDTAIATVREGGAERPATPIARPDAAREAFTAGEDRLDLAAGSRVTGSWAALARLLRGWTEDLTDEPAGALALEATAAGAPRLVHLGEAAVRIWPATLHVDLYARDADGIIRDRAAGGADPEDQPRGDAITPDAGWTMDLPIDRTPEVPAGGVLEAWALLDIDGPDGPVRARLTLTVPATN